MLDITFYLWGSFKYAAVIRMAHTDEHCTMDDSETDPSDDISMSSY